MADEHAQYRKTAMLITSSAWYDRRGVVGLQSGPLPLFL